MPAAAASSPEGTSGLSVHDIADMIVNGTAPAGMHINQHIELTGHGNQPFSLPAGLHCYELSARNMQLSALPPDLKVDYRLDLTGCENLRTLPENLTVGTLIVRDCVNLQALPEGLNVHFLDISGCTQLTEFPRRGSITYGAIEAVNCLRLRALPDWITHLSHLNLRGCASMERLPDGLAISSWVDLADTRITALPAASRHTVVRWRGVPAPQRVVFQPETLTAAEVLEQPNAELRRVMLERMGYERFMAEAQAVTLDADTDAGGKRELLRVEMERDEDLVCLSVLCPSTARQYIIRVPPTMRTCHQAAAWIAGFDNPDDYHPLIET